MQGEVTESLPLDDPKAPGLPRCHCIFKAQVTGTCHPPLEQGELRLGWQRGQHQALARTECHLVFIVSVLWPLSAVTLTFSSGEGGRASSENKCA